MIAVLVPVLARPDRVRPLVESCAAASTLVRRMVFLITLEDTAERQAVHQAMLAMPEFVEAILLPDLEGGDYARKINLGIASTEEPWVFQAGDDIRFHPGWDTAALAKDTGPHVGVIGTNDLGNPLVRQGRHSTHSLIRRTYVEEQGTIDEPGKALHEGYWHCWVDNELIETAVARRAYTAARGSRVEHLHHIWHKGTDDETYRRGQRQYSQDHALFKSRRSLWRIRPGR